jgi:formylglycine-generating enzyme required for sulfatase activity
LQTLITIAVRCFWCVVTWSCWWVGYAIADEFDPNPLPDDLVLPMPNGARMIFRPVFLGIGADSNGVRTFNIGDRTGQQPREKLVPVELGGSFIGETNGKQDWLYYIGKYEVTRAQYRTVEGGETEASNLPMTNLPRLAVESFLQAYNRWLQKEHPEALPKNEGSSGFVRLANEEEWEFAARGGCNSSPQQFEAHTPYPGTVERYEWTQNSSFNKLKPVGMLLPNPLKIYDMLGNAAEMTNTPYQLEHGKGRQGGYVVRGGSFRNTASELRASQRTEQPLVGPDGLAPQDEAYGFRLVIASQVVSDPFRRRPLAVNTPTPPPSSEQSESKHGASNRAPPEENTQNLQSGTPSLVTATREHPFANSLGMRFVPVAGTKVLFSIYQTRRSDYFAFAGRTYEDPEVYHGLRLGGDETHPMINVSQTQALQFCRWLEKRDLAKLGLRVKYRLPTSVEWTTACGEHRYPWGDSFPPATVVGNYGDLALSARIRTFETFSRYLDGYVTTAPVGRFPGNKFGLFDLGSNVQEWTMDADAQGYATVRGASWRTFREEDLQTRAQVPLPITIQLPFVGFRCVIEMSQPGAD